MSETRGLLILQATLPSGFSFSPPPEVAFMLDRGDAYVEYVTNDDGSYTISIRSAR